MKKIMYSLSRCSLMFSSYQDFLKEEPCIFLSTTNFYQNEGDAIAASNISFVPMEVQTYY